MNSTQNIKISKAFNIFYLKGKEARQREGSGDDIPGRDLNLVPPKLSLNILGSKLVSVPRSSSWQLICFHKKAVILMNLPRRQFCWKCPYWVCIHLHGNSHVSIFHVGNFFFLFLHPSLVPAAREIIPSDPRVVMLLSYHLCSKGQSSSPAEDSEEVQVKLEACDMSPLSMGQLWAWCWDVLSCWGLPSAVEWTEEAELWIITWEIIIVKTIQFSICSKGPDRRLQRRSSMVLAVP